MKLYFLGTCSGTEPLEGRNHASIVLESHGKLYFFDAGEGCSRTAHLLGLDLLATQKIIISHPHMDHVGGLANLLWTVRKICLRYKREPLFDSLDIYLPDLDTWDGIMRILRETEGNFVSPFSINGIRTQAGVLFDDGTVRVTAFPNLHVQPAEDGPRSCSFLIECEGNRIVYSGDLKSYAELDAVIGTGCDVLIGETAHHKIDEVCAYILEKSIGRVFFTHHKREIMNDPEAASVHIGQLLGDRAVLAYDGMEVTL